MSEMPHRGALDPYRILDLTEGGCALASRLLADMGADVIKVEPPGGSPSRSTPPFYGGEAGADRSLFWFACNLNKRSITLDIAEPRGRELFKRLVAGADFLFESYEPGYLDSLGLGYPSLQETNRGLIMVSITPFGQSGPYAHYKGPDIVTWAMGGYMWMCGDPERAPVRPSVPPQAYFHASGAAASAALIALYHRGSSGEGQHIDQSAQACGPWLLTHTYQYYEYEGRILQREGAWRHYGNTSSRMVYPCRDGHVVAMLGGGSISGPSLNNLVRWMEWQGVAPGWLTEMDWASYDARTADRAQTERIAEAMTEFFQTKTKDELLRAAVELGLHIAPVNTVEDVLEDPHLKARDYWQTVEHPELPASITYPGAPFRASETPWSVDRRPPLVGEHNQEVYEGEMGLTPRDLQKLADSGVVKVAASSAGRPLDGLKVVDLSTVVMGPAATRILGDYGATVIKVESATRPDGLRSMTPYKDGIAGVNRSGYFAMYNAGKLSLTINLRLERGREFFKRFLVPWADVILEAFAPRVAEGWGMSYEDLKKIRPDLILLRASLMGHSGPSKDLKGTGQLTAALAGWYELTGWPDSAPVGPYSAYSDFVSWNYALVAILSALDHRRRTGEGQYIDQSLLESTLHFATPALLDCAANGVVATRMGNRDPSAAPHGVYRCLDEVRAGEKGDRWCAIAVTTEEEWRSFRRAAGDPEWTKDSRFVDLSGRKKNEDDLDRLMEEWTSLRTAEEVMALLQDAGVPAGVVQHARDLFQDPQLQHRGGFVVRDHAEIGPHRVYTTSFRLSATPGEPRSAAPLLGNDTEYICRELLGISEEELADWVSDEALD